MGGVYDEEVRFRLFWLLSAASLVSAQGPQNVLLVVNGNSPVSREVGDYYRQKREIPAANLCTLTVEAAERVDHATFEKAIRAPIAQCIAAGGLQDKVLYIVLAKGVPLIITRPAASAAGANASQPVQDGSVDSALTMLYSGMVGLGTPEAKLANPYYIRNAREGAAVRFSHRDFPMYLVTRLDGYDVNDVKALIERGLAAAPATAATTLKDGRFIFDRKAEDDTPGNNWLSEGGSRLRAAGVSAARIEVEATGQFLNGQDRVLGYASWGSNDPGDHSRYLKNRWLPGALMAEFVSTDARSFERPPDSWNIGSWKDSRKSFFHDSPQTLIGDYIHEGVTGVSGNVSEPLLEACVRPQILFPAYVQGLNLAESFYAAMPYLNWKGVVIGDPLVSPFAKKPLAAEEADPPVDRNLGLPGFFAKHLVAARARAIGETPEVTELLMTAERLGRKSDIPGARQAAERAYKLAPDSVRTLEMMAQISSSDQSIPLYRKVVEISPQNAGALNNLAFMLALKDQAKEALPYAARAADIGQGRNGSALDTYGWILYLLGQYPAACGNIEKASALLPSAAEVTYHLGMCRIKTGRAAEGRAQLERALTLKPDARVTAEINAALRKAP